MARKQVGEALGARERQIMDAVYRLKEASVGEVLAELADPPSYSSVRTMIRALEAKGLLQHRSAGTRYVYRPTRSPESARASALQHLMRTFFGGSAADAAAALLDPGMAELTGDEIARLEGLIEAAKHRGK